MIYLPDLYLDEMSSRNRADQYARRRLLVDPEGEEAPTGSNRVCLHIEWSGEGMDPNFQGAARYPSAWKGCKILVEVDDNGDVVDFNDEVEDVDDVDDHAKDGNVEEARNQFASGHGE